MIRFRKKNQNYWDIYFFKYIINKSFIHLLCIRDTSFSYISQQSLKIAKTNIKKQAKHFNSGEF